MNSKRKKVEELILSTVKKMEPGATNYDRYKERFNKMSDLEFDRFMKELKDKKRKLQFIAPNMKVVLQQSDLLAAADHIGAEVETRITFTDPITGMKYTSPYSVLFLKLPVRRTRQFLKHGISVPEGDSKVDMITGQVIKPDQASRFSNVEMQLLYGRKMTNTITEFMKVRGGDIPAYANYNQQLEETGEFSLATLNPNTVPRSTMTTELLLKCMCLDNNLVDGSMIEDDPSGSLRVGLRK